MTQRTNLTWEETAERATHIAHQIGRDVGSRCAEGIEVYGVPRGGIPAAQLVITELAHLNHYAYMGEIPSVADVIIDDIVDSGKTRERFKDEVDGSVRFYSLVDKTIPRDKDIGWVVFPWERMSNEDMGPAENVRRLIEYIGDNPEREGLKETPARVIKSYEKLFGGYDQEPDLVAKIFKDCTYDEMVLLKDIEFYSTCEHHMLPFFGKAHIAYIPGSSLLGISKLARVLEIYARRLQIQEQLCNQVTDAIVKLIEPKGAACVMEAQHFCMTSRGVEKQNSILTTSSLKGVFLTDARARAEFMSMIKGS